MKHRRRIIWLMVLAGLAALTGISLWRTTRPASGLVAFEYRPAGVMGTQCTLTAVVPAGRDAQAAEALQAAEAALRRVEAHMSGYLLDSDVGRLNAAAAGEFVKLSAQTLEVLRAARRLTGETQQAFDVTFAPLFALWSRAGQQKRLPSPEQLARARANCGWDKIELFGGGAVKATADAGVDLGGIAKGFGIDRAAEAMIAAGALGGLIDVGGDIRCFGRRPGGGGWSIVIRDPFAPTGRDGIARLRLSDGAVCTSGNYFRFTEIAGRRYSHIGDPRTGSCADLVPSVTVVAPSAMIADAWATALSVLGPAGLELLPAGVEAMIVTGTPENYKFDMSGGFEKLLN